LAALSFFVLTAVLGRQAAGRSGSDFDQYFTGETLRIDVIHSGTSAEEEIAFRRAVSEGVWGGPRRNLVPPDNAGEYVLEIRDQSSGKIVFRRGFSTLFGEWQTTVGPEAPRRAFEETYEVPFPRNEVRISVALRGKGRENRTLFETSLDPRTIGRRGVSQASARVYDLAVNGSPADKVDIVILGDGYPAESAEKFVGDCRHIVAEFFSVEPFASMRDRFNVRAVHVPSADPGVDEPRKGLLRDTAFGMSFDTFGSERYCMTEDVWAIHDAAAAVPHDAILLMANTSRYGGGAIFNLYTAFASDNEYDDYLCVHEFGHGFAGLADEYYTSEVSYNEFYPRGVEPWEANITALLDGPHVKWEDLIEPGTPVPTPADDERYRGKTGAFEGAGYAAKGLYRPAVDCRMFSKANREFCPVCKRAIVDAITYYAPE
jgi:hypothetical protein